MEHVKSWYNNPTVLNKRIGMRIRIRTRMGTRTEIVIKIRKRIRMGTSIRIRIGMRIRMSMGTK